MLDEAVCHDLLLHVLNPDGLHCSHGRRLPGAQAPHDRHPAPSMDFRRRTRGAVFNRFTGTVWAKSRYPYSTIVQIPRGIAQGVPTKHLAAELGIDRGHLLERRRQIQDLVAQQLFPRRATCR